MSCERARRCGVLLVFALVGCYSYIPLQTPAPGMDVRARLKPEAAVKRSQNEDPIIRYDGTVVQSSADELALDVIVARGSSGLQDIVMRDTITFQTIEIQSITQRKFSAARTVLFTVGAGVAAFGIFKGIESIVGGTDEIINQPPPAAVVPVFTVRHGLRFGF